MSGGFNSGGYNLVGNGGGATFSQTGDQAGTGAAPLNPQLMPLALNGGTTPTHLPMSNSTAIDKGNSFALTTDQRNAARPTDLPDAGFPNATGGDGADIGAVEVNMVTAASVTIGGRVLTPDGRSLRNARVTLTGENGSVHSAQTNAFGYYRFDEVSAGANVVISVSAKRYSFAPRVLSVTEEINDLNFTAEP